MKACISNNYSNDGLKCLPNSQGCPLGNVLNGLSYKAQMPFESRYLKG